MANNSDGVSRSALFVLAHQLDGFCFAVKYIIQFSLAPGEASVSLLKKLNTDFDTFSEGVCVEGFPEITEGMSASDMLVVSETLKGTIMAFMTPEEKEEYHKQFGFQKHD